MRLINAKQTQWRWPYIYYYYNTKLILLNYTGHLKLILKVQKSYSRWPSSTHLDLHLLTFTLTFTYSLDFHLLTFTFTYSPWPSPTTLDLHLLTLTFTYSPWPSPTHLDLYLVTLTFTYSPWPLPTHLDFHLLTLTSILEWDSDTDTRYRMVVPVDISSGFWGAAHLNWAEWLVLSDTVKPFTGSGWTKRTRWSWKYLINYHIRPSQTAAFPTFAA